jgi:hypothetical protein
MYLEDDWLSTEPLTHYLDPIEKMFKKYQDIGYIRLRSSKEKVSNINLISKEGIGPSHRSQISDTISKARIHFTFNPAIIRSEVLASLLPFAIEIKAIQAYHSTGLDSAQLEANCFKHIGSYRASPYID